MRDLAKALPEEAIAWLQSVAMPAPSSFTGPMYSILSLLHREQCFYCTEKCTASDVLQQPNSQ